MFLVGLAFCVSAPAKLVRDEMCALHGCEETADGKTWPKPELVRLEAGVTELRLVCFVTQLAFSAPPLCTVCCL